MRSKEDAIGGIAKKLSGKVAVITGGSTGMGLATTKRLFEEGMDRVFVTGRRRRAPPEAQLQF